MTLRIPHMLIRSAEASTQIPSWAPLPLYVVLLNLQHLFHPLPILNGVKKSQEKTSFTNFINNQNTFVNTVNSLVC